MLTLDLPNRYRLISLLGEGGTGRVYRVHDMVRGRGLALKLVSHAESTFLRREFDALRQIGHENLIQVFDWGALASGESFYTMELVEGNDWERSVLGSQSADEVRRILTGLLRGLAHLHCHGEIHGDIKPSNVLLGLGGVVKLTDVGMGGSEGKSAGSSGTPGYAAPEIWEGAVADERSDLYSVGVMAYEALTGRHPFEGRTVREVVAGQLEGWAPSPAAHGARVPENLERAVMRALERDPGLRQGSADEFMEGMGVQDRVGLILGGKISSRMREIDLIVTRFNERSGGAPTLYHLVGARGAGKASVLREVEYRAMKNGGASLDISDLGRARRILSSRSEGSEESLSIPGHTVRRESPYGLAELVWEESLDRPLILWQLALDATAPELQRDARDLARYLWALSIEHGEARQGIVFLLSPEYPPHPLEEFEAVIPLGPLSSVADVRDLVDGRLGRNEFQPSLLQKTLELTGGLPGSIVGVLTALASRGVIERASGVWRFRDVEGIDSLRVTELEDEWESRWSHLQPVEQSFLVGLALLTPGLPARKGILLQGSGPAEELVPRLISKGWIRRSSDGLDFASGVLPSLILRLSPKSIQIELARRFLEIGDPLEREQRSDLLLVAAVVPLAIDEAVWAASEAFARGELRVASRRLRTALGLARDAADKTRARTIALLLADLSLRQGLLESAESVLEDSSLWSGPQPSSSEIARRELLLGQMLKANGDLGAAREHLEAAATSASEPEVRDVLRARIELAEIDWRYGTREQRAGAAHVLRSLQDDPIIASAAAEERAAVHYGLGCTLFYLGELEEASRVLRSGCELNSSDQDRARMANALGAALTHSGDLSDALSSFDLAWRLADRAGIDEMRPRILGNRGGALNRLGRVREAAEEDLRAAKWARRLGLPFDFTACSAGAAINLIQQAQYEDALRQARDALRVATQIGDGAYAVKALECEALATFLIGDLASAGRLLEAARGRLESAPESHLRPRLLWLEARICRDIGEVERAAALLAEAEGILGETRDLEDLFGVQIEADLVAIQKGNARALERGLDILRKAASTGLWVVVLEGAPAIAEFLLTMSADWHGQIELITDFLAKAEEFGWRECAWRLNASLGAAYLRAEDTRSAQARFGQAQRTLREVAGDLGAAHRAVYLGTPRVRHFLFLLSSAT